MDEFLEFTRNVYSLTGIDLSLYKRPQMERRLTSLRDKHGIHTFQDFFQWISREPRFLNELLEKMTIHVSEFMRNPERWTSLLEVLKPSQWTRQLRCWSAACSTGEEPYTLAMLLREARCSEFQIHATDIDQSVLQMAEIGEFRDHQVKLVPQPLLAKYFQRSDSTWCISSDLKRHVQWAQHNLLSDPYPQSLDLIICRNVLIYFTEQAKEKVVKQFAKSLNAGGYLFVGSTEQFLGTDRFGLVNVAPFLYQKATQF